MVKWIARWPAILSHPCLACNTYEVLRRMNAFARGHREFVYSFMKNTPLSLVCKAYVYERLNMKVIIAEEFTSQEGFTPLYVARQNILPGYCGFLLLLTHPSRPTSTTLFWLFTGVQFDSRQRLRAAAAADSSPTKKQDSIQKNRDPRKALTIVHMQGPLFLFVAGAFLSFAAFLGENSYSVVSAGSPKIRWYHREGFVCLQYCLQSSTSRTSPAKYKLLQEICRLTH
ncbi:hypothetical protein GWK47_006142 [Chionoecetes opilio]|uniref:Transmembrane protein n=1 Tax=Chionoecetes opilio TaxID=41210 RepID=A0A8J4YE61_CHIOP|nr:hypothetical protein GWK47_006142 [Chionoecetes opilio]